MSDQYLIVIFVPIKHADEVRKALAIAGAGKIGNYNHCSFSSLGYGRFMPASGSNPFSGEQGELNIVEEERIEVVCSQDFLKKALENAISVHPYEEPVFMVFRQENFKIENGNFSLNSDKKTFFWLYSFIIEYFSLRFFLESYIKIEKANENEIDSLESFYQQNSSIIETSLFTEKWFY